MPLHPILGGGDVLHLEGMIDNTELRKGSTNANPDPLLLLGLPGGRLTQVDRRFGRLGDPADTGTVRATLATYSFSPGPAPDLERVEDSRERLRSWIR